MKLTDTLSIFESYDLILVLLGLAILATAALPRLLCDKPLSLPILVLAGGVLGFAVVPGLTPPDPLKHRGVALRLAEIGVIVSLMSAGLKIDRVPDQRTWSSVWRLLAITMPLSIAAVAGLGWMGLGLVPAAAVLLGAVLAPTDPVLASEVMQVGPPGEGEEDVDPSEHEDEVQFTLTAEAGLNDALAFPFTYLALLIFERGTDPAGWIGDWLLIDVLYRLSVGLIAGYLLGRILAAVLLRLPVDSHTDHVMTGLGSLAATLLCYGLTESIGGYGFLAVFVGALTIRGSERSHDRHETLHYYAEQTERLLAAGILLALGGAIAGGILASLDATAIGIGMVILLVVRPVAGWIGLLGSHTLEGRDRLIVAFFGIRGIGSLYYLAYVLSKGPFPDEERLWAITAFVVAGSVLLHGITGSPAMKSREQKSGPHHEND